MSDSESIPDIDPDDHLMLGRAMLALLEGWGASGRQQVSLLGLPDGTPPRALKRYKEGTVLPDEPRIWERIEHLAAIADALRTTFPRNQAMGPVWMRSPNRRLDGRTPLATMVEDGLAGVVEVREQLDCAWAWQRDQERGGRLNAKSAGR